MLQFGSTSTRFRLLALLALGWGAVSTLFAGLFVWGAKLLTSVPQSHTDRNSSPASPHFSEPVTESPLPSFDHQQTTANGAVQPASATTKLPLVRKPRHGLSGRQRALCTVSFWKDVEFQTRLPSLLNMLQVFATYTVEVDVLLVTNERVEEAEPLVLDQILRPHPKCHAHYQNNLCVPWEAVGILRKVALTGRMPGNDTFDLSGPHLTELEYDYFMYWEGDMEIPADSFNFWRMHVEDLYDRGYLLLPYRLEVWRGSGSVIFTDWVSPGEHTCGYAYFDDRPPAGTEYEDFRDSVYVRILCNPYAAGWMLTKRLFLEYNATTAWDEPNHPALGGSWWLREAATIGLLTSYRYGRGSRPVLNHERIYTRHQQVMHNIFPQMYERTDFQEIILACSVNRTCAALDHERRAGKLKR
mmetsp:Transcript_50358/g.93129  ORF Transcript_50358/g.93129 Transcript_50358/m.93129 type:complete len:414 (+) Transcript_50358:104-1345(+)